MIRLLALLALALYPYLTNGLGKRARFRVVHAPCHAPSLQRKHIRRALALGADSVAFSESYWRQKYLATRPRWRRFTGSSKKRDSYGRHRPVARDVTILVRRKHKIIDHGSFKAASQSTPLKIAPERWIVWVIYRVGGHNGFPVLHVALHPHAAVQGAWGTKRAAQYRREMRKLVALVRLQRIKHPGLRVTVTGDLNYHPTGPVRPWSPKDVFAKLGLSYTANGLDWIAWSTDLDTVGAARAIPPRDNGQDHDWLVRTFRGGA